MPISDKVKKLLNKFSSATIKAAMNESPAVMQAAGWDYDKNGNLVQGDPNAEGPTKLREGLAAASLASFAGTSLASIPSGAAFSAANFVEWIDPHTFSPEQVGIITRQHYGTGADFLTRNTRSEGGSIHIKPENRGKFTALKERTGHSASWFKENGTPAQKKMAVFALNARKWNHADGGPLSFEEWYKTVPKEKNDTTNYNLRRAYEFAPKEDLDAFVNSDEHLYSVYENPKTGEYEFMKSAAHPSLLWELAAYNSDRDFNREYGIVPNGMYLKYVPYADGGPLVADYTQGYLYPAPDSIIVRKPQVDIPVVTVEEPVAPAIDLEELKKRQYFIESKFNDKAVNKHSGAMGAYQIMPITLKDYTQRTGETGDLYDYAFNEKVRDFYMNRYLNSSWATKNNQSEYNRAAKALAAYNWGPGNLIKYLEAQKKAGVDIYNGTDWLKGLPGETRNYIKWTLDGEDIGMRTTNAGYEKAKKKRFDFGGYIGDLVEQSGGDREKILEAIKNIKASRK